MAEDSPQNNPNYYYEMAIENLHRSAHWFITEYLAIAHNTPIRNIYDSSDLALYSDILSEPDIDLKDGPIDITFRSKGSSLKVSRVAKKFKNSILFEYWFILTRSRPGAPYFYEDRFILTRSDSPFGKREILQNSTEFSEKISYETSIIFDLNFDKLIEDPELEGWFREIYKDPDRLNSLNNLK
nr:hypothetical protein [uncultured Cohaesibacter sp.]